MARFLIHPIMPLSVHRSKQAGFGIIEVLIALLIIGSGLLGMVKLQMAVTGSGPVAKQRSEAVHLGQKKIEDLRSFTSVTSYDAYFGGSTTASGTQSVTGENATYTLAWNLTDNNSNVAGRYADIALTVTWTDQKGETQTVRMRSSFARVTPSDAGNLLTADQTTAVVCTSGVAKSWTVGGLTCSGSIGSAGSEGTTVNVVATTNTGSDQFVCGANGQWTEVSSYAKSCSTTCPSESKTWSGTNGESCSANLSSANNATVSTISDTTAPVTGSATYTCGSDGNWSAAASTSCTASCSQLSVSWGTTASCSGTLSANTAPNSSTLNYSVGTVSGSTTYACTNAGAWQSSGTPTCVDSSLGSSCPATTLGWTVSGQSCSANAPQTASGSSVTISQTSGTKTGTATFTCNSGAWGSATNASCVAACLINFSGSVIANPTISMKVMGANDSTYVNVTSYCTVSQNGQSNNYSYVCNSVPATSAATYTIRAVSGSTTMTDNITNNNNGVVCGNTYNGVKLD